MEEIFKQCFGAGSGFGTRSARICIMGDLLDPDLNPGGKKRSLKVPLPEDLIRAITVLVQEARVLVLYKQISSF